jgi:hypothetical protein
MNDDRPIDWIKASVFLIYTLALIAGLAIYVLTYK